MFFINLVVVVYDYKKVGLHLATNAEKNYRKGCIWFSTTTTILMYSLYFIFNPRPPFSSVFLKSFIVRMPIKINHSMNFDTNYGLNCSSTCLSITLYKFLTLKLHLCTQSSSFGVKSKSIGAFSPASYWTSDTNLSFFLPFSTQMT